MIITDKHIPEQFEVKDVSTSQHIGSRIIFRCPDSVWSFAFALYIASKITIEPFPFNHFVWSK